MDLWQSAINATLPIGKEIDRTAISRVFGLQDILELINDGLNSFTQELLLRLQESGVALPSYTTLDGRYALRVCITNHRTETDDLQVLIDNVLTLGRELAAERAPK